MVGLVQFLNSTKSQEQAEGMAGMSEDRAEGGRAGQELATGEFSPPPGDFSPVVKKRRGRPPKSAPAPDLDAPPAGRASPVQEPSGPAVPARSDAAPGLPADLGALRDRQREDCAKLAAQVKRLRELDDLGAGREGNQAAALGTLTRATAALHEMERAAYGLGQDAAQGRDRVILLPVPVDSMADWARQAAAVMGIPAGEAPGQVQPGTGPRRASED